MTLLHDYARSHSVALTVEALRQMKFGVRERPLYSLDLVPSDCHLFSSLKEKLCGQHFSTDQEVNDEVHEWHYSLSMSLSEGIKFFYTGAQSLLNTKGIMFKSNQISFVNIKDKLLNIA